MKILILGSMSFSKEMNNAKIELEKLGHNITLPNFIDQYLECESKEEMHKEATKNKLSHDLYTLYFNMIKEHEAILIINLEKKGIPNYIGANALIEMSQAHILKKKIFLLNDIPEMDYTDEIKAMNLICLNQDLTLIK